MRCIDADNLIGLVKDATILGDGFKQAFIAIVRGEPTIEPERKTGKWILVTDSNGQHYVCDHCGEWRYHQNQKFCGECGYVMMEEGEQE